MRLLCGGDFLEGLVDGLRGVGLTDGDALDDDAGAIGVEDPLHGLGNAAFDVAAAFADGLVERVVGDHGAHRAFRHFADRFFRLRELEEVELRIADVPATE